MLGTVLTFSSSVQVSNWSGVIHCIVSNHWQQTIIVKPTNTRQLQSVHYQIN